MWVSGGLLQGQGHVTLLVFFGWNVWKIFLLGIPGQIAIFLWFRMFRGRDKEETHE